MEKQLRILILEDDPADAELIQRELDRGTIVYICRTVSAWKEFEVALEEFQPDLVLSDYDLGNFTGLDALAVARRRWPDLPFILITGALREQAAAQKIREGATDYLLKDRISQLVPAILRALREGEQRSQRRQAQGAFSGRRKLSKPVRERDRGNIPNDPSGPVPQR